MPKSDEMNRGWTQMDTDLEVSVLKNREIFSPLSSMAGHSLPEMRNSGPSDPELLGEWLQHQREPAFREIVARYAGLVHATARRTCGDELMAAEVSQLTFITLARKAKSLTSCASFGGWLHRTAMMHSKNLIRRNLRENRKRQHLAMETHSPSRDETWQGMQPALDDALDALSEKDREALLLRFYRTLSIREVAATLGITTDAAQKRIDRATERLRGKLARRGCMAGGSLGAAMLAGFAADAQAAAPTISLLSSKAVGAASSGMLSTTTAFLGTSAMQTTSIVTPLVILLAAGVWLTAQYRTIGELENQTALLQRRLVDQTTTKEPMKSRVSTKTALDGNPVNWAEVARQLRDGNSVGSSSGGFEFLNTNQRLLNRFLDLTREELIANLDEVDAAEIPRADRDLVSKFLLAPLIDVDPGYVTRRLGSQLKRGEHEKTDFPSVLARWTLRDPEQATDWLDGQTAAGTIAAGSKPIELAVISALLPHREDLATRRLSALPESQRDILWEFEFGQEWGDMEWAVWKERDLAAAFARLARLLPEEAHLDALRWILIELGETDRNRIVQRIQRSLAGMDGPHDGSRPPVAAVKDFFQRIEATPAERKACIETLIKSERLSIETLQVEYPEALQY